MKTSSNNFEMCPQCGKPLIYWDFNLTTSNCHECGRLFCTSEKNCSQCNTEFVDVLTTTLGAICRSCHISGRGNTKQEAGADLQKEYQDGSKKKLWDWAADMFLRFCPEVKKCSSCNQTCDPDTVSDAVSKVGFFESCQIFAYENGVCYYCIARRYRPQEYPKMECLIRWENISDGLLKNCPCCNEPLETTVKTVSKIPEIQEAFNTTVRCPKCEILFYGKDAVTASNNLHRLVNGEIPNLLHERFPNSESKQG